MMEEQYIYVENEENVIEAISISEEQEDVESRETVAVIDASEATTFTVVVDEAFAALGESNEQLKHSLLNGRELSDQHPITAITGLRNELDEIEALKTVYSNDKNYANYYMWQDENPSRENRGGFFVSLCPTTNKIKICDSDEVFGVTVSSAGFIGGQDDVARDDKYGLVVCNGVVTVRCETDVTVGDYVVPNKYGVAEKAMCSVVNHTGTTIEVDGQCGYLVVALDDTSGVSCADIIFDVSASQLNNLENSIHEFNVRIDNTETNITSAINVANEAYYLASNLGDIGKLNADTVEKANDALEKAEQALGATVSYGEQIAYAKKTSEEAKTIAQNASTSAEKIRTEAVDTANDALAKTNNLVDALEPITTWTDEDGNTGATYLVEYIDDGLATKTEVETVSTMTEELKLQVSKNAAGVETAVSSVATYSLGEYSQSYGLTQVQARAILEKDAIYVPTVDHTEKFVTGAGTIDKIFTKGYYYTWDGWKNWIASDSPYVGFSSSYITGSDTIRFWVVDAEEPIEYNGIIYEPDTLHMWKDNRWVVVADLASNPSNRIANTLRYTANSLAAEITNARGSFTGLDLRLEDTDSKITLLTSWQGTVDDSMATIGLTANDMGASIAQIVESVGADGEVSAASIVTAINDYDSAITLNANRINLNGAVTANNNVTIGTDGKITAINADISGKITATDGSFTGSIISEEGSIAGWDIKSSYLGNISTPGNSFFLSHTGLEASFMEGETTLLKTDWFIYANSKFGVTATGDMYAKGGYIADWEIKNGYLGNLGNPGETFFLSHTGTDAYWGLTEYTGLNENWYIYAKGKFGVTSDGDLYARNADITGKITATSGSFTGSVTATSGTIGGCAINSSGVLEVASTNITSVNADTITTGTLSTDRLDASALATKVGQANTQYAKVLSVQPSTGSTGTLEIRSDYVVHSSASAAKYYWTSILSGGSDRRIKNSINYFSDDKMDDVFDSLKPCKYRYNEGYSFEDKCHYGFIAQDVEEALSNAGISSEDQAVVIQQDDYWRIKYDEFIALNTWQIQKLKKRVAELEAKLEQKEI